MLRYVLRYVLRYGLRSMGNRSYNNSASNPAMECCFYFYEMSHHLKENLINFIQIVHWTKCPVGIVHSRKRSSAKCPLAKYPGVVENNSDVTRRRLVSCFFFTRCDVICDVLQYTHEKNMNYLTPLYTVSWTVWRIYALIKKTISTF